MGTYTNGTPVNLVERFWRVDPLTGAAVLADPAVVTFTVVAPDDTHTVFTSGDPEVTNPFVGVWVCTSGIWPVGAGYVWRAVGTGNGVDAASGDHTFDVVDTAVAPTEDNLALGPCQPWITGEDVARCGPDLGVGSDTWKLDNAAADGSYLAFELSGRNFQGICERSVRPCSDDSCAAWDVASGLNYWGWAAGAYYGWGWYNREGRRACGCDPLSVVRLSGYPVREILQVKINGDVLPPVDGDGNRNYRLDPLGKLVRMDTPSAVPGGAVARNFWPSCQNLSLDDSEFGTFSVTYKWGQEPPSLGKAAAAALARELYIACVPGTGKCALPTRVTKVVRQGVTMDRIVSIADMLRAGSTGIQILDAFIAASNPDRKRRKTAVYSPDVQPFAKRVG